MDEPAADKRRSAELFDIIMAAMADAIVLVDAEARLVYANPAASAMHAAQGGADMGDWEAAFEHFRADGVTPLPAEEWPVNRAVRGEEIEDLELVLGVASQRKLRVLVSGRPIRDALGGGAVLVYRDITEAREAGRRRERVERIEAVGQLAGGVAHDFNNVLTVVAGSIELLKDGLADHPKQMNLATMIERAAGRGANLTRQLLAFARRQPLQPEEIDVNALVNDAVNLLGPMLDERIEIETKLDAAAWRALIDPSLLSTALLNLAMNARDAMPGGGKLTLETGNVVVDERQAQADPDARPGAYVMVAVGDTGSGIPLALQERLFEPFFTTKAVGQGTGLSLSMVYGFVKQSEGHIKVHSEEGRGTTIALYLPRAPVPAGEAADRAPDAMPRGCGETILVVEDDEMVRNTVIAQLGALGYVTLAARDGAEALALVENGARFDLLFTDIVMPGGMNGRELADELARRTPALKVLYTSGYTENAITHHGRLDPGVALLTKPYRKEELARKIHQALGAPR
ncbi:MAG: ATP-binding protein [Alphaproteobacteria bacterium]